MRAPGSTFRGSPRPLAICLTISAIVALAGQLVHSDRLVSMAGAAETAANNPPVASAAATIQRLPAVVHRPATPRADGRVANLAGAPVQKASATQPEAGVPVAEAGTIFPLVEVTPIDLASALSMVDVQNPEFLLAQSRVVEAMALRQLAAVQFLPNLNLGTSYDDHTGNLQQSDGNILSVKRSSLYVGAGASAIAAGTVNIPGIVWNQNPSASVFGLLVSRQLVAAQEAASTAERNEVGMRVVRAYLDLLEAEGRRGIYLQSFSEASELARLTEAYAVAGQGRPADYNRAETEKLDREALVAINDGEVLIASARLAELLNLDPSLRLHPTDNWVVPHPIVPDQIPIRELLTIALLQRPELRQRQAAVRTALLTLNGQRLLPFSPNVYLGFSAGEFGGGSNLVSQPVGTGPFAYGTSQFGSFAARSDLDAMAYWTLRNVGLGNRAQIDAAASRMRSADWERLAVIEQVRMEVANAHVRAQARLAQVQTSEQAIAAARDSWTEDLIRIRGGEGWPIEAVNSLRLFARARLAYLTSIVEYNRAQFELYVALGQPPAGALVRKVNDTPVELPLPPPAVPPLMVPP